MQKLPALLLLLLPFMATAQKIDTIPSRINLGLNFATLYSGIPEPQLEYYFNKNFGLFGATGYTLHPVRGWIKIGDMADLQSLNGAYWKLGLKARLFRSDKRVPLPWVQLLYVGSQYSEKGTIVRFDTAFNSSTVYEHNKGVAHGIAGAIGADFRSGKRFIIRVGFQAGYYNRNDHLGSSILTFQPGFGPKGFLLAEQVMLCLMYRIGNTEK